MRWTSKIGSHEALTAAMKKYNFDITEDELRSVGAEIEGGDFRFGNAKRFFTDKADGASRPLVILAPKDKMVMRAMLDVIQPELSATLSPFCYSRTGAGTAHALAALHVDLLDIRPASVIIGDFTDYYGQIDREALMAPLYQRFETDPQFIELLLNVIYIKVIDECGRDASRPSGIEQGLPLSPLLSNLYLGTFFDAWVQDSGIDAWGRFGDDFYVFPRASTEAYSKHLGEHLESVSLPMKESKVQKSGAFSDTAVQALDPDERNESEAFEWLKTRFVPHRMMSGRYNIIVERAGVISDDGDE